MLNQERGLVTRALLKNGELVDEENFTLRSSDLTEMGLAVIRKGMGGWEKEGCPASDLRPLEKAFKNETANHSA